MLAPAAEEFHAGPAAALAAVFLVPPTAQSTVQPAHVLRVPEAPADRRGYTTLCEVKG